MPKQSIPAKEVADKKQLELSVDEVKNIEELRAKEKKTKYTLSPEEIKVIEQHRQQEEEIIEFERREDIKRKANAIKLQKQYKKESKLVEGIFRNLEVPGAEKSFWFKKFPQEKVKKYTLYDGKRHEIPLSVAIHLNKNAKYPVHAYKKDKDGVPVIGIGKMVDRLSFDPTGFLDTSDKDILDAMPSHIVSV